jgi:hypothetical protein
MTVKSSSRFSPMAVSAKSLLDTIEVDEGLHSDACGEPQAWLAYSKLCKGIPVGTICANPEISRNQVYGTCGVEAATRSTLRTLIYLDLKS